VRNSGRHLPDKGRNENNINSVAECPLWLPEPSHPEDTDRSEYKRKQEKRQRKTTIVSQQQPKIKTIDASESSLLKKNKSVECIYKNPIDIKPYDSDENIYSNPIVDEETFINTFLNNKDSLRTRMKHKSYAGMSRISETENVSAEWNNSPIRQANRKFSLGTVLRRLSTNTLFKRDNNLDKQEDSDELSDSEFENDEGEFQINSSSWEYINKTDESNNIHIGNCFKSKLSNTHNHGSSNNTTFYKYDFDSGISTLE